MFILVQPQAYLHSSKATMASYPPLLWKKNIWIFFYKTLEREDPAIDNNHLKL